MLLFEILIRHFSVYILMQTKKKILKKNFFTFSLLESKISILYLSIIFNTFCFVIRNTFLDYFENDEVKNETCETHENRCWCCFIVVKLINFVQPEIQSSMMNKMNAWRNLESSLRYIISNEFYFRLSSFYFVELKSDFSMTPFKLAVLR